MSFIGTTAAVALGGALIPFAGFLLRVLGLLILVSLALAYCSGDDGHPARTPMPNHAVCASIPELVPVDPPMWSVPDYCRWENIH